MGHHRSEQRTTWRPAAVVGLFGGAGLLAFLVLSGTVFSMTNGSEAGLLLTIGMLWIAGVLAAAGIWIGLRGLRRASQSAAIHQWRPRTESEDRGREDAV